MSGYNIYEIKIEKNKFYLIIFKFININIINKCKDKLFI